MVDCNCHKCVTGEVDVFAQGECLVRQSNLELRRLKLDMQTSGVGVLLLGLLLSSGVFIVFFSLFYLIHQLKQ